MLNQARRIHGTAALRKVLGGTLTKSKSNVPGDVVVSAQRLRLSLSEKSPQSSVASELKNLALAVKRVPNDVRLPLGVFQLVQRVLEGVPASEVDAEVLQALFDAAIKNAASSPATANVPLLTKLYSMLHRTFRISASQRLENGIAYYSVLRSKDLLFESEQVVTSLLNFNAEFVDSKCICGLLEATAEANPTPESVLHIIREWKTTRPSFDALKMAVDLLVKLNSVKMLNDLVNFLYFTNAHYIVPKEMLVLILDAYLQLSRLENGDVALVRSVGGVKILEQCFGEWVSQRGNADLETLELLLMSCIHFREPAKTADVVAQLILTTYPPEQYTKETLDVLAQWAVYTADEKKDLSPIAKLRAHVLANDKLPLRLIDSHTLAGVLVAASEKAQCSEAQIDELVKFFEHELKVVLDASVYEVLIRRALKASETKRANELFINSNCDWNAEGNRYLGVLSDLLVGMCRTTSIPRQEVVDCYERVRMFAPHISYEAQLAMLEMFLSENNEGMVQAAGFFLAAQFGESPDLPFEKYRLVFELIYRKLMVTNDEELAAELSVLLNSTIMLPYEAYYPLCAKLCSLNREDLAHLFFRQMRNRAKQGVHKPPGEEIYLLLFAQYANRAYELGIRELDTYFRLDVNNEMTVPIMNRILAGYSSIGDSHKMANLWTEVASLPAGTAHGPNSETLTVYMHHIAQRMPLEAVDDVWRSAFEDYRVKPDAGLLKQYVIANCYHGYYTRALALVKDAGPKLGIKVNSELLEAVYNFTLLPNRKEEVREFAISSFPREWQQLVEENRLKEVLLPSQNAYGDTDEQSRRWQAIEELEAGNRLVLSDKV